MADKKEAEKMAAQQAEETAKRELFEAGIDQQAETLIQRLEKANIKLLDRFKKKEWAKDKIRKGFTILSIAEILKENKYDFESAGFYLDNLYKTQKASREAVAGVTEIKEQAATEKLAKKRMSQIVWIISSFVMAGVGIFLALFLQKQVDELGELGEGMGMATSMLGNIVKGGWIIAIAGGFVGTFLVVFVLADYFKQKAKKKKEGGEGLMEKQKMIEEKMARAEAGQSAMKTMQKDAQQAAPGQAMQQAAQPTTRPAATNAQPAQKPAAAQPKKAATAQPTQKPI